MNQHNDSLGNLASYVDALEGPTSAQTNQAQKRLLETLAKHEVRAKAHWRLPLGWISTVAAGFALVAVVNFWPNTQSVAFAEALQQLREVANFRATTRVSSGDTTLNEIRGDYSMTGTARVDMPGNTTMLVDTQAGLIMTLLHQPKKFMTTSFQASDLDDANQAALSWLRELQEFQGDADVTLPAQIRNGQEVIGFQVNQDGATLTLWASTETGVPVSLEVATPGIADIKTQVAYELNVQFPESHFELTPPEGYTELKQSD